jgi:hypothetical protein
LHLGNNSIHLPFMRLIRLLAVPLLAAAAPAAAQQQSLGVFGLWGAFSGKERCHAVAEPHRPAGANSGRAFASAGWWPGRGVRGQLHFRLSQPKRAGSAVLLRIEDRTFQLVGGGADAWALDARADAEIVAAMRSERGALIRDSYNLRGAATALDAAAIACATRR